jgi:hypothetical protein
LIGQPLALRALDCAVSAFSVVNAKGDAVRIAKVEFVQVSLQVVFPAVLIDARHATFEDTKKSLDRVCRHVATGIFAFGMIDALMLSEFLAGLFVVLCLVGMQATIKNNIVEQNLVDGLGI